MEKEKTAVSTVGYLAESTVGDQARRADKIPAKLRRRAPVSSTFDPGDVRERIAQRAYELYLQRGGVHGHDVDDWLEAEQIVLMELESELGTSRTGRSQGR